MSKRMYDRTTFVAAMIGLAILLAIMDADCAIDPKSVGCYITNGKSFNWVAAAYWGQ